MPLSSIALFWSVTLALFYLDLFGIYAHAPNKLLLLFFMIPNVLILLAVNRARPGILPPLMVSHDMALRFFRWAFVVSLILLPFNIRVYTGSSPGDFIAMLKNPVEAYARMHDTISTDRSERMSFLLIKLAVSWLSVALVPLAILLHKNRHISLQILIGSLAVSFVFSVFRGTDKELADIMIFIIAGVFIATPYAGPPRPRKKFRLLSKQGALLGAGGVFFLCFFVFRKSERLAGLEIHCFQNTSICMQYPSSEANPLGYLGVMLYRYTTHGYYGLATSFDATWVPCPVIGASRVMQYVFGSFGVSCETTMTQQLDNLGWTSTGAWSTGFTSLANNFGHIAVYAYILFFAVSLKIFHQTYARTGCYLSGILYFLNFFILFYMVGNLQLQQVGEQYFGYLILNALVLVKTFLKQTRGV